VGVADNPRQLRLQNTVQQVHRLLFIQLGHCDQLPELPFSRKFPSVKLPGARHRSEAEMFEGIGKPNLATLLTLGLVSVVLPKLLPQMGPAVGTAVKIVIDR
jgi:hypothetical protein